MGAFVISKRFNGDYKFVFTSRKGKTIFTSPGYASKEDCELKLAVVKDNIENSTYMRFKAAGGKFFFRLIIAEQIIATSRKYTTELRLQKGIDEIMKSAATSEVLDFSEDEFVFPD
jgi:uncharacterized protein YegP (UPF0339 family)